MDFHSILPGTLAHKVAAWCCENTDSALTVGEICEQFDVKYSTVDAMLRSAVTSNVLSRSRETLNGTTCITYRAGMALMKWVEQNKEAAGANAAPTPAPSPAAQPAPKPPTESVRTTVRTAQQLKSSKSRANPLPLLDVSSFTVDKGINLASAKKRVEPPWDPVFRLLTEAGQSTTAPIEYQRTLSVAASHFGRRNPGVKLSVGIDVKDATRCRVLRQA